MILVAASCVSNRHKSNVEGLGGDDKVGEAERGRGERESGGKADTAERPSFAKATEGCRGQRRRGGAGERKEGLFTIVAPDCGQRSHVVQLVISVDI